MEHNRSSDTDPPERSEVYERIPWEHLEKRANDRQWLYVGVAGAIALGVLAYSFVRNQPVQPRATNGAVVTTEAEPGLPPVASTASPDSTLASPVVVAEADLYALDPERLAAVAAAHAEWFAVEYFSVDGSAVSADTLRGLLPEGLPLPEAPEGTQVFVDWVGTRQITMSGEAAYEVDVLVRSLLSTDSSGFARQPVRLLRVAVQIGDDGEPRVVTAPLVLETPSASPARVELADVPPDVANRLEPDAAVIGGDPKRADVWRVIVMTAGVDGVTRPQLIELP